MDRHPAIAATSEAALRQSDAWHELEQANKIAALTADLDEARELLREVKPYLPWASIACVQPGSLAESAKVDDLAARIAAFLERKP